MKLNRIFLALFTIAILATSCNQAESKVKEEVKETVKKVEKEVKLEKYKLGLDETSSKVMWKGDMLKMYSHSGTVDLSKGKVEIENGTLIGGHFEVDMTSMKATDENYKDGKKPEDLVGHLSSPDFFDVANHPTANFVVTSGSDDAASGKLTVRGITDEEKVTDIVISKEGDVMTLTGKMTFDRKKYGVSFDHPAQEMVLSDDIILNFNFKAKM